MYIYTYMYVYTYIYIHMYMHIYICIHERGHCACTRAEEANKGPLF